MRKLNKVTIELETHQFSYLLDTIMFLRKLDLKFKNDHDQIVMDYINNHQLNVLKWNIYQIYTNDTKTTGKLWWKETEITQTTVVKCDIFYWTHE